MYTASRAVAVMTENANSYAAVTSTHILGSPNSSSKAVVFDYEVPMYQIVFKGFVSMSVQGGEYQTLDAVATGVALKYAIGVKPKKSKKHYLNNCMLVK